MNLIFLIKKAEPMLKILLEEKGQNEMGFIINLATEQTGKTQNSSLWNS